ncbi:MAG: hypothetical protein LKK13_05075 [Bacilli bacterium]|jgi:hypothetical protein|nr:hypothetical protein [Bacilli bacterium]
MNEPTKQDEGALYVHAGRETPFPREMACLSSFMFCGIVAIVSTVLYSWYSVLEDHAVSLVPDDTSYLTQITVWKAFAIVFIALTLLSFACGLFFRFHKKKPVSK